MAKFHSPRYKSVRLISSAACLCTKTYSRPYNYPPPLDSTQAQAPPHISQWMVRTYANVCERKIVPVMLAELTLRRDLTTRHKTLHHNQTRQLQNENKHLQAFLPRTSGFTKLPTELQIKIWRYSFPGSRVIQVHCRNDGSYFFSGTSPPAAFHTCRISRNEALSNYEPLFDKIRDSRAISQDRFISIPFSTPYISQRLSIADLYIWNSLKAFLM